MDTRHKKVLQKHYTTLVSGMDPEPILQSMRASPLFGFDSEKVARIDMPGRTESEKNRMIIEVLTRAGPQAFHFYVEALYRDRQTIEIAKRLARGKASSMICAVQRQRFDTSIQFYMAQISFVGGRASKNFCH